MIVIVMGVSGSGKSTIGELLAQRLGWQFYDGDLYHSEANVAKMSQGIPLTDEDRAVWLDTLAGLARASLAEGRSAVIVSSALKEVYRQHLTVDPAQTKFVYLKGSYDLIMARMLARPHHFMKPGMLDSQFATLEEPHDALTVDITPPPAQVVDEIIQKLGVS